MADTNKILTIVLAIIICIAALVLLYVNLPNGDTDDEEDDTTEPAVTYLTVIYEDGQTDYTLEELEALDVITGYGGYRTSLPAIKDQGTYTGVPVTTLVTLTAGDTENYTIIVNSEEDGVKENKTYAYEQVQGNMDIYNASNASEETPIDSGDVTMIVCYQKDGEYLDESEDGKLKIAFINEDEEKITKSSYWWKFVVSIEIFEE